ncbi:MAG: pentapeptide repeat-containing protein [Nitrospinota bacterium]
MTEGREVSQLREISEEEFEEVLRAHKEWLDSGEKSGKRADLQRADLRGFNPVEAHFEEANLRDANLL